MQLRSMCRGFEDRDQQMREAGEVSKEEWEQVLHWLHPDTWLGHAADEESSDDTSQCVRDKFAVLDANKVRAVQCCAARRSMRRLARMSAALRWMQYFVRLSYSEHMRRAGWAAATRRAGAHLCRHLP